MKMLEPLDLEISLFPPVESGSTAVEVAYATSDGTAVGSATPSNGDFETKSGSVSFAPGEPTKSISVNITNDNLKEDNESFTIEVSTSTTGITRFENGIGTVTIRDDDTIPVLNLVSLAGNILEGTLPEQYSRRYHTYAYNSKHCSEFEYNNRPI